jgi:hypothetical protein
MTAFGSGGVTQTLGYDIEGHLASVQDSTSKSYLYDVGSR